MPTSSRTWSSPPSTRRSAPRRSWPRTRWAASPAGWAVWTCRASRHGGDHAPSAGYAGLPLRPPHGPLASGSMYPAPIQRLVTELSRLPGVGQRTAQRLAFYILRSDAEDAAGLAEAIREVKEKVGLCEVCFNLAEGPRCGICENE